MPASGLGIVSGRPPNGATANADPPAITGAANLDMRAVRGGPPPGALLGRADSIELLFTYENETIERWNRLLASRLLIGF
jgi:hypothetical protein